VYATKLARPRREHEMRWMGENDFDVFFDVEVEKREKEEMEREQAQRRIEKEIQQNYTYGAGTLNMLAGTGVLGGFHAKDLDELVKYETQKAKYVDEAAH
jgi:hypothetical protein